MREAPKEVKKELEEELNVYEEELRTGLQAQAEKEKVSEQAIRAANATNRNKQRQSSRSL